MDKVTLEAKKRQTPTKSALNQLRKSGKVPGVFYSKHHEPISIEVPESAIKPLVFTSKTSWISLSLGEGEKYDCVIKDVHFDPVTDRIVHFDLIGLQVGEKIQFEVPVLLKGTAIGVKEGGVVQHFAHKLEVECLPTDIPEHIEVDITNLKIGDSIHVSDLSVPGISFITSADALVVSVTHPRAEKEEVPAAEGEAPAEPEVIGKGKSKEEEEE